MAKATAKFRKQQQKHTKQKQETFNGNINYSKEQVIIQKS
jgi:hypothetical protein